VIFAILGQEDFFGAGLAGWTNSGLGLLVCVGLMHASPPTRRSAHWRPGRIILRLGRYILRARANGQTRYLEYVRWAAANVTIPWFAIGGINLANLREVLDRWARRICVVSAILNAPDVSDACRQFKAQIEAR
jgi:thiamine-phosphate pyrophosphorylase